MFQWLRTKARDAVLAGVADAADYLTGRGDEGTEDAQGRLEERVRLLPGPQDDRPSEGRQGARKGKAG